jgi:dihydrofolate reductase
MFNHMVERGQVLWQVTTSLDGFIAGPGDDMTWLRGIHGGPNPLVDEVLAGLGAVIVGRRTWGVGSRKPGGELYGGAWVGPVFVLTHHVPQPGHPLYDDPVTFTDRPLAEVVGAALDAAGGRNVNLIGAGIATQCIDAGLVDEVILHVAPVLLGGGTRLFERPGAAVFLDWVEQAGDGGVANLRLRPRPVAA